MGMLFVFYMTSFGYIVLSFFLIFISLINLFLFSSFHIRKRIGIVFFISIVFLIGLLALIKSDIDKTINCSKTSDEFAKIVSKENLFSQINFYKTLNGYLARINCRGATTILDNSESLEVFLKQGLYTMPYSINKKGAVAIIGSGAGIEVQRAIAMDYERIMAIEINKNIIDVVNKAVAENQNPYNNEKVELTIGEGRSFIKNNNEKVDLIYIAHSKRYGVVGSNSFNLMANYLFTKEAMGEYYDNLKDDGVLALINYNFFIPYNISTLFSFIKDSGIDYNDNLIVIEEKVGDDGLSSGAGISLLLFKKNGFKNRDIELMKEHESNIKINVLQDDGREIKSTEILTDNRPYFANLVSFLNFMDFSTKDKSMHISKEANWASSLLFFYLKISLIPLFLFFISIFYFYFKNKETRAIEMSIIFFFIALGFIFVELGYLNSLFLVFENPSFSFSFLLFIFILFAGLGSFLGGVYESFFVRHMSKVLFGLSILLFLNYFFLENILKIIERQSILSIKISIIIFIIGIPSIFIGSIFPTFTKKLSETNKDILIFVYYIDSIISIFAGIIALIISVLFGFKLLFLIGGFCYFSLIIFSINKK